MNMKTTILFTLVSILLSSCASEIYQVTQFKYIGELEAETPNSVQHGDITIQYYFWGEGGRVGFTVVNHSDKSIVIDFSQSSLILEGTNYPYARGRSVTNFESVSQSDLINEVITTGAARTQHEENFVFIAPASEMYFQKMWLHHPKVASQRLKSTETKEVDMPQNLENYSFRHFLTYSLDGENFVVDDQFTTESTTLVGGMAFSRLKQQSRNELRSYYCLYRPPNTGPFLGVIISLSVLFLLSQGN